MSAPHRKAWSPEAGAETAAALRLLARRPWLVAGRDDAAIAAVRRNEAAIRDVLTRLGWVLVVERDLVRLRKPPPVRPEAWAAQGPAPRTCSWFFLLVAGAESLPPRTGLSNLVTAARSAAAEAGIRATGDIGARRAIVAALKDLDRRGVVEQLEGDPDDYVRDAAAEVLLAVHHTRLAHVVANVGPAEPDGDPAGWLAAVAREPDPARRMRRRLVDDTLVHSCDLDEAEADWLSRRVRGDDGAPLAAAFGLHLERRAEGAAFVVPDDAYRYPYELGPQPFPAQGTVPHAALLLCEQAGLDGRGDGAPGPGWRGFPADEVAGRLAALAATVGAGRGGWSREYVEDPPALAGQVEELLTGVGLLRVEETEAGAVWWVSPGAGRWPQSTVDRRRRRDPGAGAEVVGDES